MILGATAKLVRPILAAMKIKVKGAPTMADDQNRLDVAELMFFLLICEGIYATSIIPTTRLRMMWIARQVEEKLASGCVEQLTP